MRIGINLLYLIPGEVGGAEFYLRRTLTAMLGEAAGDTFLLFTNAENDACIRREFGSHPEVRCVALGVRAANRPARIVVEQTALLSAARRGQLDVLWSPGYTSPLCYRGAHVVSILDMQYRRHPADLKAPARLATDILVRAGVRRCRRVIAISDFARREIVALTSAPEARVDVTPLAADAPFFSTTADPAEAGVDGPYLLCVANSYPHKNLPVLIEAFDRIADALPHRLVLVGKPRLGEPALQAALRGARHGERVVRIAEVPLRRLCALYRGASAFVFPSLYEGFGMPVLEAMAAGVPVVTTRCASIPEVGGTEVVYADPPTGGQFAERIGETLAWPAEQRRRFLEQARNRAATFTWARTARLTRASLARAAGLERPGA